MFPNLLVKNEHRYEVLLISLVGFLFLSPLLPEGRTGYLLYVSLFLLVIFSASFNLSAHLIARWGMLLFGILSLIFKALASLGLTFALASQLMMFLFFCTAIGAFARDVFTVDRPRIDHIYGAILIYFLIGMSYALAYQFFQLISPQEFIHSSTRLPVKNSFDLYYFSFITLGTVGYGDIIPQGQFAKIATMLESMTGLFYLAILVASLVSSTRNKVRLR